MASPFLLESSYNALQDHWEMLVSLAFNGRGLVVDLTRVPGYAIEWVIERLQTLAEEERTRLTQS